MGNGYAGKILVLDLTKGEISSLDTSKYAEYGGGHGVGSAVFWDLCKDKTVKAFDPGNVVTIMAGPMQGTLAPFGGGRCEVQGIGAQPYPIEWFTRSNFGGRFSGVMKFAGWDGIAITGKAEKPVWVDIRDDKVVIRDASETGDGLWGLDTLDTELKIYDLVRSGEGFDWSMYGGSRDSGRSAQHPSVLTIGPAGENLTRVASLQHEGGGGAGQGGFGGVWGSKNLKAISIIGTGSVEIADPQAMMDARAWWQENWWNPDELKPNLPGMHTCDPSTSIGAGLLADTGYRSQSCMGCTKACHGGRGAHGKAPGASCFDGFYGQLAMYKYGNQKVDQPGAADRLNRLGINAWEPSQAIPWLVGLYKQGILGAGKQIDTALPFDKVGSDEFNRLFLEAVAYRTDIGDVLAEGVARAAETWGRYDEDTTSGLLSLAAHGYAHHYDSRTEMEWALGTAMGDRDINEHDITWVLYWYTSMTAIYGMQHVMTAEEMVTMMAERTPPNGDPMYFDFSDEGIYSEAMAKFTSWHRHYTRFWKQSVMYCDWGVTDWLNPFTVDYKGLTPELEPRFYNAVTGGDTTFEQGVEIGAKIWNLDRSIWMLQGRTAEHDKLDEWQFRIGTPAEHSTYEIPYVMTVFEDGKWSYKNVWGRFLDHAKFDTLKKRYYAVEGWDEETGVPTRETLEQYGLDHVADALAEAGRI